MSVRFGIGVDVHPLVEGEKLVLGGVTIPHGEGLAGHSDGDVLTHAVIDALRPLGVTKIDMPLTPEKVWRAIHQQGS